VLYWKKSHILWDALHRLFGVTKQTAFAGKCRFYLYVECDFQGLKILLYLEHDNSYYKVIFLAKLVGWLICLAVLIVQY